MEQYTCVLEIPTRGQGLYDITRKVLAWVRDRGLRTGLLTA